MMLFKEYNHESKPLFQQLNIFNIYEINRFVIGCLTYQFLQNQLPGALTDVFKKNDQIHDHNTRLSKRLHKPLSKTNVRKFTVANKGVDIYNSLTDDIRDSRSSYSFKRKLRICIMTEEVE